MARWQRKVAAKEAGASRNGTLKRSPLQGAGHEWVSFMIGYSSKLGLLWKVFVYGGRTGASLQYRYRVIVPTSVPPPDEPRNPEDIVKDSNAKNKTTDDTDNTDE